MAETKVEKLLHEIDKKLALYIDRQEKLAETHERFKAATQAEIKLVKGTLYENGLTSKVNEMHEWMSEHIRIVAEEKKNEKLAAVKIDGETKILGFKAKVETRQAVIVASMVGVIQIGLEILKAFVKP